MSKWYLMNAYALTEQRKSSIMEVARHWVKATVYVVETTGGREMFACSAGGGGYGEVGDMVDWVQDTGNGLKNPNWKHSHLIIENIVQFDRYRVTNYDTIGIVNKVNNIGLDSKRPIWVFK